MPLPGLGDRRQSDVPGRAFSWITQAARTPPAAPPAPTALGSFEWAWPFSDCSRWAEDAVVGRARPHATPAPAARRVVKITRTTPLRCTTSPSPCAWDSCPAEALAECYRCLLQEERHEHR